MSNFIAHYNYRETYIDLDRVREIELSSDKKSIELRTDHISCIQGVSSNDKVSADYDYWEELEEFSEPEHAERRLVFLIARANDKTLEDVYQGNEDD